MNHCLASIGTALLLLSISMCSSAEIIHKWVDEDGITHYSGEAPSENTPKQNHQYLHLNALNSFDVDGRFLCPLPSNPDEVYDQNGRRMYSYTDEKNFVFYTCLYLTYQIVDEHSKLSSSEIYMILDDLIEADRSWLKGYINNKKRVVIDGRYGYIVQYSYELNGNNVSKYMLFVYSNKTVYRWSVQGVLGVSADRAKNMFYENIRLFRILK